MAIEFLNGINLEGTLELKSLTTNTDSTTALVMSGNEVQKRTLGSLAFSSATIPTVPDSYAPTNAEQNVQADWTATTGDAHILNKPSLLAIGTTATTAMAGNTSIPTVPSSYAPTDAEANVQADWDATSGDALILNKPTIPAAVTDYVSKANGGTFSGDLTIQHTDGAPGELLHLRNDSNGNGATIKFSDQATSAAQHGLLSYYHADGASYGSGNTFVLDSTETKMSFVVKGKVMYSEGIYTTPATGTGAGTRKDTNWNTAYTHSQATHAPTDAEANVQADWTATSGDAHILNKPTIPTVPSSYAPTDAEANVQADWTATTGDAHILNKPSLLAIGTTATTAMAGNTSIPTVPSSYAPTNAEANVQANWTATSGDALILNKPIIVPAAEMYRQTGGVNSASVGPGWITVAKNQSSRRHGEVIVSDSESSDHAFIRIDWMRSYADSNFSVLNVGGHANRITGVRVLSQDSDNTYGWKYLQVYVTVASVYGSRVNTVGTPLGYTSHTVVTPILQETISGYTEHGNTLTDLDTATLASEEGITAGGIIKASGGNSTEWNTAYTHSQATHAPTNAEQNVQANWTETTTTSDAFILNKPSTFTPSAHNQAWSTITSTPTTLSGYGITDIKPTYINHGVQGDHDMHTWDKVHAVYSDASGSNTYWIITTNVPQDNFSMGGFELILEDDYSTQKEGGTIKIYGYWNPETNGGFTGFKYTTDNPNLSSGLTIQVGRNTNGKTCFAISGHNQNYAQIIAKNLWLGYSASSADSTWGDSWSIATSASTGLTNLNTLTKVPDARWDNIQGIPTLLAIGTSATTAMAGNTSIPTDYGDHTTANYIVKGSEVASAASWTTATRFGSVGELSAGAGNHALSVRSENTNDAFMSFHIGSDYAVHFGLDGASNRLHVGGWSDGTGTQYQMYDSRDGSASNWNTAYGWGNHASGGYMKLSSTTEQSIEGEVLFNDDVQFDSYVRIDSGMINGTMTMGTQFALVANNYGRGVFGLYNSGKYQHVWGMGTSWKLSDDGSTTGNLYGIAYTHTNVGGQSKAGLSHQTLFMINGVTQTAIGAGIWTSGLITTTSYGTSANWKSAYDWGNHASGGYAASSHNHNGSYVDRYQGSVSCNNSSFTTAFTVNGSQLASAIRFSVRGTSNNVVICNLIDIVANHSLDIQLKAQSGNYTRLSVQVITNNNEDFAVLLKHNGSTNTILSLEVVTYGDETIAFTSTNPYSGSTFEVELPYGNYMGGTGGDNGDLEIAGVFRGNGGGLTSVNAATVDSKNASDFVQLTGTQTITGVKTFNSMLVNGNSTVMGTLNVGSAADGGTRDLILHGYSVNKQSRLRTTNGNLHIDSAEGHSLYLNYYYGASTNIYFGSGNGGSVGSISSGGLLRMANDVVAYYSFSDKRLKTDIKSTEGNLEKILSLNPVEYTWKEGPRKGVKEIGLIAQEVEEIVPEVVRVQSRHDNETGDGIEYKQVDYEHLVSTLIGAMQEQQKQIDELKSMMCKCKK